MTKMKYNFEKGGLQPGAPIPTEAEWKARADWFYFFKKQAAESLRRAAEAVLEENWNAFEEELRCARHDIATVKRRRKTGH